jgi:PAS domain S-box
MAFPLQIAVVMPLDDDRETMASEPRADRHDSPEERERAGAWRRGEVAERCRATGVPVPLALEGADVPAPGVIRLFAALADNVRDYAIFLMNTEGVITYWGEGARLIKWWSKEVAEGSHLRLLYPPGGAEDGTAEEHLRQAAERGEYTGEGTRIRNDGSTFWAGVTLTALWDDFRHPAGIREGDARPHRAPRRRRSAPDGRRGVRGGEARRGGRQRRQERLPGDHEP